MAGRKPRISPVNVFYELWKDLFVFYIISRHWDHSGIWDTLSHIAKILDDNALLMSCNDNGL